MEMASPACSLIVGNESCSLAASQEVLPLTLKFFLSVKRLRAKGYLKLMKETEFWCKDQCTIESRGEEGRGEEEEKVLREGF